MENRKKEILYHSRIQLSFSCFFSPQLIFAEALGIELMLLRFFFSYILRVVLGQERSFFPTFGVHGVVFQGFLHFGLQNDAKECIV